MHKPALQLQQASYFLWAAIGPSTCMYVPYAALITARLHDILATEGGLCHWPECRQLSVSTCEGQQLAHSS